MFTYPEDVPEVVLMRHLHAGPTSAGYGDAAPLTELGKRQLGYTRDLFALAKPQIILCSQLIRALEPAFLGAELDCLVQVSELFNEFPDAEYGEDKTARGEPFSNHTVARTIEQAGQFHQLIDDGYTKILIISHHHRILLLLTFILAGELDRKVYDMLYDGYDLRNGAIQKLIYKLAHKSTEKRWHLSAWTGHFPASLHT